MTLETPLVSVVLAVFDGEAHLDEAVGSILAQTYPNLELIIADDGSSDATPRLADGWARRDRRVRALHLEHRGQAAAINTAVAVAQGGLVARMDHDDVAHPGRIAAQVAWMRRHSLDVCGSWARRFGDRDGQLRPAVEPAAIALELMFACPILDPTALIRTEVLRRTPYPQDAPLLDHALWNRLAPDHRLGNLPRLMLAYRAHPGQLTATDARRIKAYQRMLRLQRFAVLFPAAPSADKALFHRIVVAHDAPLDEDELAAAGSLFVRYLAGPHPEARARMVRRWRRLCRFGVQRGARKWAVELAVAAQLRTAEPSEVRGRLSGAG